MYRPNPQHCCEACAFGEGPWPHRLHALWCAHSSLAKMAPLLLAHVLDHNLFLTLFNPRSSYDYYGTTFTLKTLKTEEPE